MLGAEGPPQLEPCSASVFARMRAQTVQLRQACASGMRTYIISNEKPAYLRRAHFVADTLSRRLGFCSHNITILSLQNETTSSEMSAIKCLAADSDLQHFWARQANRSKFQGGIFASHLFALSLLVNSSQRAALVLEDDAVINDSYLKDANRTYKMQDATQTRKFWN